MANAFTNFLSNFAGGVFGDVGYLKDYKHAARLYQDNYYENSPKAPWSYFIEISLNPAISNRSIFKSIDERWLNRSKNKIGLLAKQADQPRISIPAETLNQYNRKTVIHSKLSYSPVGITFHDDMGNIITNFWKNYYQYYFADSRYDGSVTNIRSIKSLPPAYQDTKYQTRGYAYGLNNGQSVPFIQSITIFLLNRKQFNSTTIINPIITEYSPGQLDQTTGNRLLDIKMTFAYEAVYYDLNNRAVSRNEPGFNNQHYDNSPSPISISGKGTKSIFGPGGLIAGATDIFGTLSQDSLSGADILRVAIQGKNLISNAKNLTKSGIKDEVYSITNSIFAKAATGQNATGQILNSALSRTIVTIPKGSSSSDQTVALSRNIGPGGGI